MNKAVRKKGLINENTETRRFKKNTRKQIEKMMETEDHKLGWPRHLDLNADDNGLLLSYLIGQDTTVVKDIPPEVMAKVLVAVCYWTKMAFNSCRLSSGTIDQALLNAENSTMTAPLGSEGMPKGLTRENKFYFSLEPKLSNDQGVVPSPATSDETSLSGEEIILTDAGVYLWSYLYVIRTGQSMKHPKNLKTRARHLPQECKFTGMGSEQFKILLKKEPMLGLDLIYRIKNQLDKKLNEANRAKLIIGQSIDKIVAVTSRIRSQ